MSEKRFPKAPAALRGKSKKMKRLRSKIWRQSRKMKKENKMLGF